MSSYTSGWDLASDDHPTPSIITLYAVVIHLHRNNKQEINALGDWCCIVIATCTWRVYCRDHLYWVQNGCIFSWSSKFFNVWVNLGKSKLHQNTEHISCIRFWVIHSIPVSIIKMIFANVSLGNLHLIWNKHMPKLKLNINRRLCCTTVLKTNNGMPSTWKKTQQLHACYIYCRAINLTINLLQFRLLIH